MGTFFEYLARLMDNPWFVGELILIVSIIIYQIYHSINVGLDISELKNIFEKQLIVRKGYIRKGNLNKNNRSVEDIIFFDSNKDESEVYDGIFSINDAVKISVTQTVGKGIIKRICDDINNYLLYNYGASVNFSMIKDIIDREVDMKDEEISNTITTPLYLGLAATMVGIILGLFSIPGLDEAQFSDSISSLIEGVKLAMFGSLIGLGCTTALSSFFYKDAKKIAQQGKNRQISYLQAMLLPELLKAEESGYSGLKNSIEKFSRDTTELADIYYKTAVKTEENLKIQNDIASRQSTVIHKIDSMGISRIARANLELFDKFEKNAQSFNHFSSYLELMGSISSQLNEFASRTANVDDITKQIGNTLLESKKLTEFLSSHFAAIEKAEGAALMAVNIADSHFKDAIGRLGNSLDNTIESLRRSVNESSAGFASSMNHLNQEIENRIGSINQSSIDHESKLTEIYNDIGHKLESLTKEHLTQLGNVYNEAIPKFDELKHLDSLPEIKEHLVGNNSDKLLELVSEANNALNRVNEKVNPSLIVNKLSSLEEVLKKRNNLSKAKEQVINKAGSDKEKSDTKPVTIFKAVKFVISK